LACPHCYAHAESKGVADELSTEEAKSVIDDLAHQEILVLILSGGEPILRSDLYELAAHAREKGIICALSTNGTLIDERHLKNILKNGISYVGISIDGTREGHDAFRGRSGAYESSLKAIRLCRDKGIKVGLRVSLTSYTASELPQIFDLFEHERLVKLYISHMNYAHKAGSRMALKPVETRTSMCLVVKKAIEYLKDDSFCREIVTGNSDADGPFLFLSLKRQHPGLAGNLYRHLMQNGGNAAGGRLANIDTWGEVHPDPFSRHINLGNVRRQPFSQIWNECSDPLVVSLRQRKTPFKGRCGQCRFIDICGGNSRARAFAHCDDWWGSDPLCYLSDEEIGMN
jgi:radical SAM protein with 4Fe4S-binding SPASM domain